MSSPLQQQCQRAADHTADGTDHTVAKRGVACIGASA
jgi:hypothetical protein